MRLSPPLVVFVKPQAAGNIGALARVMSNFGCAELRLVGRRPQAENEQDSPFLTMDWALAKCGREILEKARWYEDLSSALHGVELAIGTSGRDREFEKGYARPMVSPAAAFETLSRWQETHGEAGAALRWAAVLGSENGGLTEIEASLCQKLVRLDSVDENPSLNIAMAAGLFLYHWHLYNLGQLRPSESPETGPFLSAERADARLRHTEPGRSDWATVEHKERFLAYLMEVVERTAFKKYPDGQGIRARVRRWLQAAPIPLSELMYGFEIVYHLRATISGRFENRDFLKTPITGEKES